MNYSIREVCEQYHITAHTLRYYEKIGLLTEIQRTPGGIRFYSEEDLETLGLICCLKHTGMPLSGIARFIQLTREGEHTLKERCQILTAHQNSVVKQMEEMQKHLNKITCKIEHFTDMLHTYEQKQQSES